MKTPFITGKKIYLRPLHRKDLNDNYLNWLNDPVITRYLESGKFPTSYEGLENFYTEVTNSPNQVILAITDSESDEHIGNVKLAPISWIHRRATFGILIGNNEYRNRGIGTEVTHLMLNYAFFKLNLQRIDLGVYANHETAVKMYEKIGFQIEGRFRRHVFYQGTYIDLLWMGLLISEYRCPSDEKS
jgi:RimJ/RimL family protein N-acetyltransferase